MTILFPISFQCVSVKREYLEHHGVSLLIVSSYAYLALMFMFHCLRNALQRLNSLVQLTHYNRNYNVLTAQGYSGVGKRCADSET